MPESEVVSSLIGDIYDTPSDPVQWLAVIEKCAQFIGGPAAALFFKDAASKTGDVVYYTGVTPYFKQLYFEKYIKLDPPIIGHVAAEIGELVAVSDIIPYEEFLKARAYREWGRPQGLIDMLNVALDKTATSASMFCVFRNERNGRVDDEMRRRMRLLVPHLRRAVLISSIIDLRTGEAAAFVDATDSLSAGMFFVDETLAIVHANASGHAMLASGDLLSVGGGRLVASNPQSNEALAAVLAAASLGDAALGIAGIAQPLDACNGERYVAHVLPLTSGARRQAGKDYRAVAVLFVRKAQLQLSSAPEAVAKTYNLTPAELRVLFAIVHVGGVPETSEVLGVTENTVRTHLQRVFEKTGTNRQANLVNIVANFSSPFAT